MDNFDASRYNTTLTKVDVDGETLFRARVREFPDLEVYGASATEAFDLALDAIHGLCQLASDMGHPFPDPESIVESYSGRVTLRVPTSLHKRMAEIAQGEGVSLNQYISNVLAFAANSPVTAFSALPTLIPSIAVTAMHKRIGMALPDWYALNTKETFHTTIGVGPVFAHPDSVVFEKPPKLNVIKIEDHASFKTSTGH